jgi:hypothetical protein
MPPAALPPSRDISLYVPIAPIGIGFAVQPKISL